MKAQSTPSHTAATFQNLMNIQSKTIIAAVASICLFATAAARADTITIAPDTGFTITWDGNEGDFFGGAVPANLAPGGTEFFSSNVGPGAVNDGLYGNSFSWRSGAGGTTYVGVALGGLFELDSVAWGRDNLTAPFLDRYAGSYELQFTQVASPGTGTTDTGNPLTGWDTIGLVTWVEDATAPLGYLRHEFEIGLSAGGGVTATGFRILTTPISPNTLDLLIDEIELYGSAIVPAPEPSTFALVILGIMSLGMLRRRRR